MQHHQIDINRADIAVTEEQWRDYIYKQIHKATPSQRYTSASIILSVPLSLYDLRPQSYQPKAVTIGPLWRNELSFTSKMDKCKALCINQFMKRRGITSIEELINYILGSVDATIVDVNNLHNLYHDHTYTNETIKLMLLIDLVFLHELLLFYNAEVFPDSVETSIAGYLSTFLPHGIAISEWVNDLFKIGNQVPLTLLEGLVKTTKDLSELNFEKCLFAMTECHYPFVRSTSSLAEPSNHGLLASLLHMVHQRYCRKPKFIPTQLNFYGEHLLDCLYNLCVQPLPNQEVKYSQKFVLSSNEIPRASELIKVGINFKPFQSNISGLHYDKRNLVFYLPRMIIFDETEDILRNLVAYEQTSKQYRETSVPLQPFALYVGIMDDLIHTKDDLAILYKSQVLENHVGSDEKVLSMWNDIGLNILLPPSAHQWGEMMNDIQKTYRSPWREIYIEFHNNFLSRPWLWATTIGACLLLVMTFLQTVFTIKK